MRNRCPKRAAGSASGVGVYPLLVVRGIGKQLHLRLRDRHPITHAGHLPQCGLNIS